MRKVQIFTGFIFEGRSSYKKRESRWEKFHLLANGVDFGAFTTARPEWILTSFEHTDMKVGLEKCYRRENSAMKTFCVTESIPLVA